jgi:RecA/RadA recombinase
MPPTKKTSTKRAKREPRASSAAAAEPQQEMAAPVGVSAPDIGFTTNAPRGAELHTKMKALIGQINKDKDHKVMAFAEDVPNAYELRRPSGIMQLDLDTGGGLPAGTLCYLSGPDGAGKTFLAMRYLLMHQKLYGDRASIAFACAEGGFDFRRAINMGLKINVPDEIIQQWNQERQQRGFPSYTKEEWGSFKQQVGEFVLLMGMTGEELLQAVLEAVRSKLFGIIALDSVSALQSQADSDKDMDEAQKRAAQAGMLTNFMQKYMPLAVGIEGVNYTTVLFTSQVRANQRKAEAASFMQKFIKDWSEVGAWAARHTKAIDVCIWAGEKLNAKSGKEEKKVAIGKVAKYELLKGKHGTHEGITGDFNFYHEDTLPAGVDESETVIIEGMKRGVILERGGTVVVINPETGQPTWVQGAPNIATLKHWMDTNFELQLAVRREVLASKGIMCLYR